MHLLISALSFPTPALQITAFLEVLAREMVRQGVDVTVVAPQSLTTCWKHKIPLCPQRYELSIETEAGLKKMSILRPFSLTLGQGRFNRLSHKIDRFVVHRTIKKVAPPPDIIYSHFWLAAENVVDYAVNNHIPLFVATGEHKINIDRDLDDKRIAFIRENTNGVICVSTKNKVESIEHRLTDGRNAIVLPNAVDNSLFYQHNKKEMREKLGFPQDVFIVAFCGRFSHRKGCRRLSDAITMLGDRQIKSVFIGQAVGEGLADPVCEGILHKGPLNHHVIPEYLSAADVFVLPTLAEGCSNSIVEAMSCGLPIISSDMPFNYDVLDDGNAILVDPMKVEEIAKAISKIKENKELREQMSMLSLKKAGELGIEKRVEKILAFVHNKKEVM